VFLVTLAVGAVTVAAISLSPFYVRRFRLPSSARFGAALVAASVGLGAVSVSTPGGALAPSDQLFLCLFATLLLGALLILGDNPDEGDDDSGGGPDDSDGDPPWWPEFESGFRSYVGRPRHPVTSR
jgi:hypothetical protein